MASDAAPANTDAAVPAHISAHQHDIDMQTHMSTVANVAQGSTQRPSRSIRYIVEMANRSTDALRTDGNCTKDALTRAMRQNAVVRIKTLYNLYV